MPNFPVHPTHTALINVDIQNCFIEGYPISAPDGLAVLEKINRLAAACRKGILNKGSQSAALHKDLIIDPRDILLDKPRFGAFHGTDLELILRTRNIDTLIISGVATNVCCETTAREAAVRDFKVFFLSDGTATAPMGNLSAEQLQTATCTTLGFLFAEVLTVDQMIAKIQATPQSAAALR
jgi:nicotinamidase-related amidase